MRWRSWIGTPRRPGPLRSQIADPVCGFAQPDSPSIGSAWGLSAKAMGLLLKASYLSVYNWERGHNIDAVRIVRADTPI
jgi:hypothetical protein